MTKITCMISLIFFNNCKARSLNKEIMASAIVDLCHAASKVTSSALLDSNPLQHVNACFHVVNSTIKRRDGIIEIVQSRMLQELVACVQSLQINLISGQKIKFTNVKCNVFDIV